MDESATCLCLSLPTLTVGLVLGTLGLVTLLLAVSGLFGVIAYSMSKRTLQIGIRMALGAQWSDALGLVLRLTMIRTTAGMILAKQKRGRTAIVIFRDGKIVLGLGILFSTVF